MSLDRLLAVIRRRWWERLAFERAPLVAWRLGLARLARWLVARGDERTRRKTRG